jgi:hypothetical protein
MHTAAVLSMLQPGQMRAKALRICPAAIAEATFHRAPILCADLHRVLYDAHKLAAVPGGVVVLAGNRQ